MQTDTLDAAGERGLQCKLSADVQRETVKFHNPRATHPPFVSGRLGLIDFCVTIEKSF